MNQLKTIILLGALSALLIAIGGYLGPQWFWPATALAIAMNLFAYFFSDRLVLRMSGAREVSPAEAPGLHRMVEDLATTAKIPKPRVCVIEATYANAFATGRNPRHAAVAVTTGLMELLDARELRGVLAHELAHISNRDVLVATVAAGLATAVGHLAHMVAFLGFGGHRDGQEDGSPAGGILFLVLGPIAATMVQLGISRSREYLADETGARMSGEPLALASALEKLHFAAQAIPARADPATAALFIVNPFGALGGLVRLFSTHPPAEERIRRLRSMAARRMRPGVLAQAAETTAS